jgi:branched-chain amino acid transport system ATP-binding protein
MSGNGHAISPRGVRRTFQNGGLFADLTVLENVLSGLHTQIKDNLFRILLGLPSVILSECRAQTRSGRRHEPTA